MLDQSRLVADVLGFCVASVSLSSASLTVLRSRPLSKLLLRPQDLSLPLEQRVQQVTHPYLGQVVANLPRSPISSDPVLQVFLSEPTVVSCGEI